MRLRTAPGIHMSSPKEICGTYSWKLSSPVASRAPLSWNNVEHYIFKYVRKTAKSGYWLPYVCLSVRLSAWNNSAPTGRIFKKLHIGRFFENLSRKFKFH